MKKRTVHTVASSTSRSCNSTPYKEGVHSCITCYAHSIGGWSCFPSHFIHVILVLTSNIQASADMYKIINATELYSKSVNDVTNILPTVRGQEGSKGQNILNKITSTYCTSSCDSSRDSSELTAISVPPHSYINILTIHYTSQLGTTDNHDVIANIGHFIVGYFPSQ